MATVTVAERKTAEEFLAGAECERGRPSNLIEGEVVMTEPTAFHACVQAALHRAVEDWTVAAPERGRAILPISVGIDDANVFAPDVAWYREGRLDLYSLAPYPMPNLAIEVRSPSTWRYDTGAKKAGYERGGLPELWLVDTTAETILAFRRSTPGQERFDVALELSGDEQLCSPLLPGFELPVGDAFRVR